MEPDQDALDRLSALEKALTVSEYMQFKETDQYLWLKLRATGYDDDKLWSKVIERGTARRQEAWTIAREMARSILLDEVKGLSVDVDEDKLSTAVDAFAEQLLVQQDIVPPTFTKWTECETCGRMPVPEKFSLTSSPHCPWCTAGAKI